MDYRVIPCETVGQVVDARRWYLGLSGMFLPGRGLGVEQVDEGSPAAAVGVMPGMVLTQANGIALESAEDLDRAMRSSNGILTVDVVIDEEGTSQTVDIVLQRLSAASF